MGFFSNGFVFTAPPNWDAIKHSLSHSLSLRLYKHPMMDLWLLDAWETTTQNHFPFSDRFRKKLCVGVDIPQKSIDAIDSLSKIASILSEIDFGIDWLKNTARIAIISDSDTFLFAADDEQIDIGCRASTKGITHFRVNLDSCMVEYSPDGLFLYPYIFEEEADFEPEITHEKISELNKVPGIKISTAIQIESQGGIYTKGFYQNAVSLWPLGDPETILGLGTFDPFENFEKDFEVKFERISHKRPESLLKPHRQPKSFSKNSWWQFWR
jgi:hypothetical protein